MTVAENDILAEVERKRGYLLSYHKMIGSSDPQLLAAYVDPLPGPCWPRSHP